MTIRTGRTGVWTMAALVAALGVASAQAPAFKRTELQRGDLTVAGREAVTAIAELPTGVASGKHTHPGEEVGYILEGTVTVEMDGKAPMVLNAGGAFLIPSGQVHNAKNTGSEPRRCWRPTSWRRASRWRRQCRSDVSCSTGWHEASTPAVNGLNRRRCRSPAGRRGTDPSRRSGCQTHRRSVRSRTRLASTASISADAGCMTMALAPLIRA